MIGAIYQGRLVQSAGALTPVAEFDFQRGTTDAVMLQWLDSSTGQPALLPTGTQIFLMLKPPGKYEADPLAQCGASAGSGSTDFTAPVSASGYYSAGLNLNTDEINALEFTPDGNLTNDLTSAPLMVVLVWKLPTETNVRSVIVVNATVFNMGYTGVEGVPAASVPDLTTRVSALESGSGWLPAVTAPTGGTSADLDSVATAGLSVPRLFHFVDPTLGLRWYVLRAGTDAAASPGIIHPTDYNASTNAKVLVLVS